MVFTEPGEYIITYTAYDDCGYRTETERTVIVTGGALQNEDGIDLATENNETIEAS